MSKVSGLFKDLTTVKEARNGRLASWDQRGKNQDYWEIPAKESITLGEIMLMVNKEVQQKQDKDRPPRRYSVQQTQP